MEIITSRSNERIKALKKLEDKKERDLRQRCLVEGEHLVEECHHQGLIDFLVLEEGQQNPYPEYRTLWVAAHVAQGLSKTRSGSTIFACIHLIEKPLEKIERVILCDNVQDPGNLGTIVRTALSFGFDGVYCSEDCADFYHEKTIRASQGAIFQMPLRRMPLRNAIKALKQENLVVLGTDVHQGKPLASIHHDKVAIVMGSEGQGVTQNILDLCDCHVRIEMSRFESLNVAIATGILCYAFREE